MSIVSDVCEIGACRNGFCSAMLWIVSKPEPVPYVRFEQFGAFCIRCTNDTPEFCINIDV